jgi:hypothetical protein
MTRWKKAASGPPEAAEGAPEAASETTTLGAAMVAGAPGTALRPDGRRCLGLVGCASTCMMLSRVVVVVVVVVVAVVVDRNLVF